MNALYGLILCGGKSSRLGFPKYSIEKDGFPLYKWWNNTLNAVCDKTYISCQAMQTKEIDYPLIIKDESTDSGPLEGIYKAFQVNDKVNWLVMACDLVFADHKDITALIKNNREGNDAICYLNPETREPFSLFTIYNSQIFPSLVDEYQSELKSARRLLMNSNVILLNPEDPNILKGINTMEELMSWRQNRLE